MNKSMNLKRCILPLLLIVTLLLPSAAYAAAPEIPDFDGAAVIELNHNIPALSPDGYTGESEIRHNELDGLGRVGPASACLSRASAPTELRAQGGAELPVGWVTARYDDVIDGRYLYSLCNLIAPSLGGSDADARNVFTGTRYLRQGMQLFEELVADHLSRTSNHVLYRVTPVYRGEDLVPTGVQMEARSVEDSGRSVSFNVFLYNIQPGIAIDYATGQSRLDEKTAVSETVQSFREDHLLKLTEMEAPAVASFAALYEEYEQAVATTVQQQGSFMVWIPTNGGTKYHRTSSCSRMIDPIHVSVEEAESEGFTPCQKKSCFG